MINDETAFLSQFGFKVNGDIKKTLREKIRDKIAFSIADHFYQGNSLESILNDGDNGKLIKNMKEVCLSRLEKEAKQGKKRKNGESLEVHPIRVVEGIENGLYLGDFRTAFTDCMYKQTHKFNPVLFSKFQEYFVSRLMRIMPGTITFGMAIGRLLFTEPPNTTGSIIPLAISFANLAYITADLYYNIGREKGEFSFLRAPYEEIHRRAISASTLIPGSNITYGAALVAAAWVHDEPEENNWEVTKKELNNYGTAGQYVKKVLNLVNRKSYIDRVLDYFFDIRIYLNGMLISTFVSNYNAHRDAATEDDERVMNKIRIIAAYKNARVEQDSEGIEQLVPNVNFESMFASQVELNEMDSAMQETMFACIRYLHFPEVKKQIISQYFKNPFSIREDYALQMFGVTTELDYMAKHGAIVLKKSDGCHNLDTLTNSFVLDTEARNKYLHSGIFDLPLSPTLLTINQQLKFHRTAIREQRKLSVIEPITKLTTAKLVPYIPGAYARSV